jgi:hypothetical protein
MEDSHSYLLGMGVWEGLGVEPGHHKSERTDQEVRESEQASADGEASWPGLASRLTYG